MDWTSFAAAIIGGVIASVIPTIQFGFERTRDWHASRETLICHLTKLYEDSEMLTCTPDSHNHTAFQFGFVKESIFFEHMSKRYPTKRETLSEIGNELKHAYKDFLLDSQNEEILTLAGRSHIGYKKFADDMRVFITNESEKLLKA